VRLDPAVDAVLGDINDKWAGRLIDEGMASADLSSMDVAGARALAKRLELGKPRSATSRGGQSGDSPDAWNRLEIVALHAGTRRPAGDVRVFVRRGERLERA
jgi:hypothetical protein